MDSIARALVYEMSTLEEDYACFICEKSENDLSRMIECIYCNKSCHFRCKRIYGNAISKARKKPFFCSTECVDMHSRSCQPKPNADLDVITELRSLNQAIQEIKQGSLQSRAAFEETRIQMTSSMATLVETNKHIEESLAFLANQFDTLQAGFNMFKEELCGLKRDNSKLWKEVQECQNANQQLASTVYDLELDLDRVNRLLLAKNAVMLGVPALENENTKELVLNVMNTIGVSSGAEGIVDARRIRNRNLPGNAAPIIVRFVDENIKEALFEKKRAHGVLMASAVCEAFNGSTNRITVRDEITSFGKDLLQKTKDVQDSLNIKYVWMGRDGKVLIKRHDGAKVEQISTQKDLESISKSSKKRALNSSRNSSTPSPQGPAAKRVPA